MEQRRADAAIAAIVAERRRRSTTRGCGRSPARLGDDSDAGRSLTGLCLGAAGVIWALTELGCRRDFAAIAAELDTATWAIPISGRRRRVFGLAGPASWRLPNGWLRICRAATCCTGWSSENLENPAVEGDVGCAGLDAGRRGGPWIAPASSAGRLSGMTSGGRGSGQRTGPGRSARVSDLDAAPLRPGDEYVRSGLRQAGVSPPWPRGPACSAKARFRDPNETRCGRPWPA